MKTSTAKLLALLLAVALVVRLGLALGWHARLGEDFAFGDSQSYWTLAGTIADGGPYQYGTYDARIFRTPGYPLLLAPIFLVGGNEVGNGPSILWGRVFSALFGTVAVGGVWWLARYLFDAKAAWIAGCVAAVYPGAIATSVLVLSEAPFCPLMLANLALWAVAWNCPKPRRAATLALAAGMAAGAATLVRPDWLLFVPLAVIVGLATSGPRKRQLALGAAALLGLAVVMTPWWIRNAQVSGRFVPTTLQVGASLYDGLSPTATGASNMDFVERFVRQQREQPVAAAEQDIFEYRLDRRLRGESLAWARAHPGRVARLAGIKFARMWNVWPNEPKLSAWPVRAAVALTYVPVLALGVLGAVWLSRRGWPYMLCWLPAVYFTLLHVVFVSSIRYRQPAMLTLIVLAAGYLVSRRLAADDTSA
jgi:4-amino-4-deoxy-L-arabinose transferase-like glycosyltransferase